jgi:hypothetical protein
MKIPTLTVEGCWDWLVEGEGAGDSEEEGVAEGCAQEVKTRDRRITNPVTQSNFFIITSKG